MAANNLRYTKEQVMNGIFGKGYKPGLFRFGESNFEISPNESVWFPNFIPHKDWKNTISSDGNIIRQEYIGGKNPPPPPPKQNPQHRSYVFAKCEKGSFYRFKGVFALKEHKGLVTLHEKVSDKLVCPNSSKNSGKITITTEV